MVLDVALISNTLVQAGLSNRVQETLSKREHQDANLTLLHTRFYEAADVLADFQKDYPQHVSYCSSMIQNLKIADNTYWQAMQGYNDYEAWDWNRGVGAVVGGFQWMVGSHATELKDAADSLRKDIDNLLQLRTSLEARPSQVALEQVQAEKTVPAPAQAVEPPFSDSCKAADTLTVPPKRLMRRQVEKIVDIHVPIHQEQVVHVPRIILQERVHQLPVPQVVDIPIPMASGSVIHVPKVIQETRVVEKKIEQVVEVPVLELREVFIEAPVAVTEEMMKQFQAGNYVDEIVDVPVVKHSHVPCVYTIQKTVEVPQIQYVDKIVEVPVSVSREVPVYTDDMTIEVPQVEFIDEIVEVPFEVEAYSQEL